MQFSNDFNSLSAALPKVVLSQISENTFFFPFPPYNVCPHTSILLACHNINMSSI